jgi:hypothetical protein
MLRGPGGELEASVYGVMRGDADLSRVIRGAHVHGATLDGAHVVDGVPSEMAMSTIERELASRKVGFESVLERALESLSRAPTTTC